MNELGKNVYENFSPVFALNDSGWNGNKQYIKDIVRKIKPNIK